MAVPTISPLHCISSPFSSVLHGSLPPRLFPQQLLFRLPLSSFISSSPYLKQCFLPHSLPLPPASSFARRCVSGPSSAGQIDDLVKKKIAQNPVVVYSKSWCPYCGRVKGLFKELGVKPFIVELDQLVDEDEVQQALQRLSGQSSVPNVFIGGKHIGGCDDTMALHENGDLIPLLKAAGAKFS